MANTLFLHIIEPILLNVVEVPINFIAPTIPSYVVTGKSQVVLASYFTSSGTLADITLTYLIGATIVQITKETQLLKPSEYLFDSTTGKITFTVPLEQYETVFILYSKYL